MMHTIILVISMLSAWSAVSADEVLRGSVQSQGSSSAVMTVSNPGVYQLSADYAGEIVISASNTLFDLRGFTVNGATRGVRITGSNVTVKNGTVRGAIVGVKIEGNNNHAMNLDLIANGTGMEITGNGTMIQDCKAYANTAAGFSLVGASRNSFYSCTALDNGGTGNAYGFISQDGVGNTFEECVAERTQTSGGSSFAAGFVLTGSEQKSKILSSQALNASGSSAFGMRVQGVVLPGLSTLLSATFSFDVPVYSVAWQQIGTSYYVAVGNDTGFTGGPDVRVLQFNPATEVLSGLASATFDIGDVIAYSVAWQQIGTSYYIAAGNSEDSITSDVRVLQFNPATGILSGITSATFEIGTNVLSVAWQAIGSSYYVAVGTENIVGEPEVRVLQFNPTTGILSGITSATFEIGSQVPSVAWQQIGTTYYLAVGSIALPAAPEVRILQFDADAGLLSELLSATFNQSVGIPSVAWQQIGSSYYLATGAGFSPSEPEVRILQFNPALGLLSGITSATFEIGTTVRSVAWQQIGSNYYVAVGGGGFTGVAVRVLQFNVSTGTLSLVSSATFNNSNQTVWSVAWQQIGSSYYVVLGSDVGGGAPGVRVLQFDGCQCVPVNNILMNNQVSGNVTGFQDDMAVTFTNSTNQWLANFASNNTTNFNIGTQFPISAAKGTGVGSTENIDASLTNGGPAEKIMATIADQVGAQITSRLDAVITGGPTPITGSTTLSTDQAYYLPAPLNSAVITITGVNYVSLDLNGNTVRNIVIANSNFVMVKNGLVYPNNASIDAIEIINSGNILLDSIDTMTSQRGLSVTNATNNDSSLMVRGCSFSCTSSRGVEVIYPTQDYYFYNSMVSQSSTLSGFATGGFNGKFFQCQANNMLAASPAGFGSLPNASLSPTAAGNIVSECSVTGATVGFSITGTNVVGAGYSRGAASGATSPTTRFGGTAASTATTIEYWRNYQQ